jgi:hypothetical protein
MPTTVVVNGSLDNALLAGILKQRLGTKYSIEIDPRGRGVKVIESSTKAAYTRIRPVKEGGGSQVQIWGQVPSAGARLALVIPLGIPLIYMQLVAARPVVDDVRQALEQGPDNAGP